MCILGFLGSQICFRDYKYFFKFWVFVFEYIFWYQIKFQFKKNTFQVFRKRTFWFFMSDSCKILGVLGIEEFLDIIWVFRLCSSIFFFWDFRVFKLFSGFWTPKTNLDFLCILIGIFNYGPRPTWISERHTWTQTKIFEIPSYVQKFRIKE